MNPYLDLPSPALPEAGKLASVYGLANHGLSNLHRVYWNLPTASLYEEVVFRGEARISHMGPVVVTTGKHTARAAADKFIVREHSTENSIWWGEYNRPFSGEKFSALLTRIQGFLQGRDVFVQDCYAGADPRYRMPIRIVTEKAWHSLFARNMFMKIRRTEELKRHVPEFTVIAVPSFQASPMMDGTRTETFIIINFAERLAIIGGSEYGGEIKKTIFTVLNFLLPLEGVLPMHCSANTGPNGDVALFFGLSGTGKTTLSADPLRGLIGDDEHGWSDTGVFNFEGGCYAKCIRLSAKTEPQIWAAIRFGTVRENLVAKNGRHCDFDDESVTENTRAAYPVDYIPGCVIPGVGGHASNVVFLTADAFGVLPPVSKLTPEQAMYYFLSGYTAKVAGTEPGVSEPQATFSTCFGAPFLPLFPSVYANLLGDKLRNHHSKVWLLNTGWSGGPFGVGKRIHLPYTRAMVTAALSCALDNVKTG